MSFGRELVVLLTKSSMFGKLEVHVLEAVWRFEPITFYIGEMRVKLILAVITAQLDELPHVWKCRILMHTNSITLYYIEVVVC